MVKRDDIKQGATIKVTKKMPGTAKPGPSFTGTLGLNERLEIVSKPFERGGLNLVKVRRHKTDEQFEVMYAFVTNFCSLVADSSRPPG